MLDGFRKQVVGYEESLDFLSFGNPSFEAGVLRAWETREKLKVTQMAEVEHVAMVIHLHQAEYFVWCNLVPNSPIMVEHGVDLWWKVPSKP